jgi:hypothetical protein
MKDNKKLKSIRNSIVVYKIYAWLIFLLFVGIAMVFLAISVMNIQLYDIQYSGHLFRISLLNHPVVASIAATLSFFLGSILFIRLYVKAEMIMIFLSIEENSRLTIELLTGDENRRHQGK